MLNVKHFSLICSIHVVAIISMPTYNCGRLQANDVGFIEKTCRIGPNPNLCVQLLEADRRGLTADVKGLALIMVNVIKNRANEALNKINQLLKGGGEQKAFNSCSVKYITILEVDVPKAIQALQSGKPMLAEDGPSDSVLEAIYCEQSFTGPSPLTNENNDMRAIGNIARSIIGLLLNGTQLKSPLTSENNGTPQIMMSLLKHQKNKKIRRTFMRSMLKTDVVTPQILIDSRLKIA